MLMIILALIVYGLCLGSFVNALVWRVNQQAHENAKKKPDSKTLKKLSLSRGRSMCPNCAHELAVKDLVPLFSWLWLRGRCRYCQKPISKQYPIVEVATAALFIFSYVCWPESLHGVQLAIFLCWLPALVGLVALTVYDLKWTLLPDRILYPLYVFGLAIAVLNIINADHHLKAILNLLLAVLVAGGIFYGLFQLSAGRWIGGGDVKLGFLLGLIAGTPARSFLLLFVASLSGCFISLPLLSTHRLKRSSIIPFGPFLILGIIVVQIFGGDLLSWYMRTFIPNGV
jgi:prepilin signal peptidase PulO-like enzyme (type II secretory pathway)